MRGIEAYARRFARDPTMTRTDDTSRDLTCRELVEFVMDYLDGTLASADRAAFEAHLAECEDCIVYLRSYRETVRLGKTHGGGDDERPPELPEDLVRAILAARRKPEPRG